MRILEGDITRTEGFATPLRGVDAIIHTAAYDDPPLNASGAADTVVFEAKPSRAGHHHRAPRRPAASGQEVLSDVIAVASPPA
jgi:hypothetical protein